MMGSIWIYQLKREKYVMPSVQLAIILIIFHDLLVSLVYTNNQARTSAAKPAPMAHTQTQLPHYAKNVMPTVPHVTEH